MSAAANISPDQAQQIIYDEARANGLTDVMAKLVTAQSGHETAGWTSNVWLSDNNGFGYGYDGAGNYFAFDSVEAGVDTLVSWLNQKVQAGTFPDLSTITDAATYATALRSNGYYTDSESNYSSGIASYFNNNLQLVAGVSVAVLVGIGLLLYLLVKK